MKIKQILEGLTDEQVDQFHTELDDLVHKHLGHSSEEVNEAHQIDWPDKDEDGDSEMERHAYNAIRHGMHAYDAYDHVYSMSRERDWLSDNKDAIIKMFAKYGLQTESLEESQALTEEQFDEAAGEKDACYHKVKSRYKVWPSAYASGALVKCRKVGAKNWGNKSKK